MILLANKYVLGAVGVLVIVAAIWGYGRHRYNQGWDAREVQAQLEVAQHNQTVFDEQVRLQTERDYAETQYINFKASTAAQLGSYQSVNKRLRQRTDKAIRERDAARAAGRAYDSGADWIGGFAACYSELGELGQDYARAADKLRGLQGYERAVTGAK